ncbi:ParB/RepB/Spo0J family partition protein [Myxococcota bacterium]
MDQRTTDLALRLRKKRGSPPSIPAAPTDGGELREIPTRLITVPDEHPRRISRKENQDDLTDSIRENGFTTPIQVCISGDDEYYVIDGSRRLDAAMSIGLESIPAIIFITGGSSAGSPAR